MVALEKKQVPCKYNDVIRGIYNGAVAGVRNNYENNKRGY